MKSAFFEARLLAQTSVGSVHECACCKALWLDIGGARLRLEPANAEALWALLGDALHTLQALEACREAFAYAPIAVRDGRATLRDEDIETVRAEPMSALRARGQTPHAAREEDVRGARRTTVVALRSGPRADE